MVFSGTLFLFFFLPLVLIVYYCVKEKMRNLILFLFSILFYAWGEPVYLLLMLFSIGFNYLCGLALGRKKSRLILLFGILVNFGFLFFFKYADFFVGIVNSLFHTSVPLLSLSLPIGISFYTFQTMSYVIDVYRGKVDPQKNLISFGTYVSLFPQLIAGPIVRYSTVERQLASRRATAKLLSEGIVRFVIGLAKKVLIANQIGALWDQVSGASGVSVVSAWLGILAFTLQIYFDFSGYSDMAIGLGKMFGFTFDENFDYPYVSRSVTEFWRRWHISLGTWFREYVYIPLGGNRVSPMRTRLNLLIVWMLTGFWHGAGFNFILWGLYYAILLILEKDCFGKALKQRSAVLQSVYTMLAVVVGWVFFASDTLSGACSYLGKMIGIGASGFLDQAACYAARNYALVFVIAIAASLPFAAKWGRWLYRKNPMFAVLPILALFILCTAYLAASSYNPFLYFRF